MDKKDLVKFCNYYRGEIENPYKVSAAWYVWVTEKDWVEEMLLDNVVTDKTIIGTKSLFIDRICRL